MKKYIAFLIFAGCSMVKSFAQENIDSSLIFAARDTIVHFKDYWLAKDYYDNIQRFRSPKNAQEKAIMIVPGNTTEETVIVYGFHESTPVRIVKRGSKFFAGDLSDTLFVATHEIEMISPTEIKMDERKFIKVVVYEREHQNFVLEEILFKGKYKSESGKTIEFAKDGKIQGFDTLNYYEVITDYYDAGRDVDMLKLGRSRDKMQLYGFKFEENILQLYHLDCITYEPNYKQYIGVKNGALAYLLTKMK